ncbi:hypothetical protein [Glaciibacter superstes]|uniref:hypothetical protein n=1 Tax=Glaciibacter superstes TaxID=501023 RepID=UPI0003B5C691|nr:hypothetical protein [Glaciibacter superstes]
MSNTPENPASPENPENPAEDSPKITNGNQAEPTPANAPADPIPPVGDVPAVPPAPAPTPTPPPPAPTPPATAQAAAASDPEQPRFEPQFASQPEPQTGTYGASTGPTTPFTATGGAAAGAASVTRRYRPLFGTILWGVILLAFAAFMAIWTIVPATLDPSLWLLGGVIAVGLVLVVAGIAAASRRAG